MTDRLWALTFAISLEKCGNSFFAKRFLFSESFTCYIIIMQFTYLPHPSLMGKSVWQLFEVVKVSGSGSEVRSSNPIVGKIYIELCFLSTVLKRPKERKKEARNDPFKFF